ncbi:DUF354 domain-containing protein [Rhodohalobacter sp. 614A]|uniref:DUF354 domain-containing protein n=1 Tax=Rhodohalobacter sp. 614A TaxID=2908649 RepID=UPI001F479B06|nr:DUF354 domain-containing protein [Rhodohalobacter sp. 614A]
MSVLFHLGHPAHFHLFKNVIQKLKDEGQTVHILVKEKDVLIDLLEESGFDYGNILPEGKSAGKLGLVRDMFIRGQRIISYCKEHRPDLLIGTSPDISYVGKYLNIPSVNVNEDDANVVPLYAWISYPWATEIISPECCNNGRWTNKTTPYKGYHELAYLHPDHFTPDEKIVSRYMDPESIFFVLRFSGLKAHHDTGIRGIDNDVAKELVSMLVQHGNVYITSERSLEKHFEPYRLQINAKDIHHILAHSNLVIGDSQTMSAEAGVLGTPYIRFNDFVGKIGYLKDLEEKYKLGFGITPDQPGELLRISEELASSDVKDEFQKRRAFMLSENINTADFIYTQIKKYLC